MALTFKITLVLSLGLALITAYFLYTNFKRVTDHDQRYGVTFSASYADYLGLNSRQVFLDTLDELQVDFVRIPVEWQKVQPEPNVTRFEQLDWYLDQAAARNVKVVLAIGNKVPRWPECYTPTWARKLSPPMYEQALIDYLEVLVNRYKSHPAIERWQVENEATFAFGQCPKPNFRVVKQEIAKVRQLDTLHPVQLTLSGEQQLWALTSSQADVIATSMYRQVALPNGLSFTFPLPPYWYTLQTVLAAPWTGKIVISELQAEPWLTRDFDTYTISQAKDLFTPARMEKNLRYARRTGLKEIAAWGVEWWYYLKIHGEPGLWQTWKQLTQD